MSERTRKRRAKVLDKLITETLGSIQRSWVKLGLYCQEVRDKGYHKELGFKNFTEWIEAKLDRG